MKKIVTFHTDEYEIDRIVTEIFPNYDFRAVEICDNDININFKLTGEVDDKEAIQLWEAGEFVEYSNDSVLNYMVQLDRLEAGYYSIRTG